METISLSESVKALEAYPERLDEYTRLVPVDAANEVLAAIASRSALCVSHVSHGYAARLVAFYPAREVTDAATYIAGITALFAAYPEDFAKRVCDPVTGLPSQLKWLPTLAEVKAALETERTKRDKIVANARWTLMEHERRRKAAEEEASYKPGTAEQRKAVVAQALRSLKSMTDSDIRKEQEYAEMRG